AGRTAAGLTAAALPGKRLQHEHAMAVLQEAPLRLAPGASARCGFFTWFEADHPTASSPADTQFVDRALALPEATPPAAGADGAGGDPSAATLFSTRPILAALELTEAQIAPLFRTHPPPVDRDNSPLLS